eukprot:12118584-Prorocentrum_lima.AAC.1
MTSSLVGSEMCIRDSLLYIAVALCLLFAPVSSYVALSVIFSISILVSGCLLYTSDAADELD